MKTVFRCVRIADNQCHRITNNSIFHTFFSEKQMFLRILVTIFGNTTQTKQLTPKGLRWTQKWTELSESQRKRLWVRGVPKSHFRAEQQMRSYSGQSQLKRLRTAIVSQAFGEFFSRSAAHSLSDDTISDTERALHSLGFNAMATTFVSI